jgi:hypothetical protein
MKKDKCIIFDFSKGEREGVVSYNYSNGQLDMDLQIEVMSSEPSYGTNIIEFKKAIRKNKKNTYLEEHLPPYTA